MDWASSVILIDATRLSAGGTTYTREVDDTLALSDTGSYRDFFFLSGKSLTEFWAAPFVGAPWVGHDSAGTSKTRSLVATAGEGAPTVGSGHGSGSYYSSAVFSSFNPVSGTSIAPSLHYDMRTATVGAGKITALNDLSGNGHDATITGGSEPTYNGSYHNVAAAVFPASDTKCIVSGDPGITTGARTFVWVGEVGTDDNAMAFADSGGNLYLRGYSGSLHVTGNQSAFLDDTVYGVGRPMIVIWVDNGSSSKLFVADTTTDQPPVTGTTTTTDLTGHTFYLGNYSAPPGSGFSQNGSTAFFSIYPGVLSQADIDYLRIGYGELLGLTITTPTPDGIFAANLLRHYRNKYASGVWTDEAGNFDTASLSADPSSTTTIHGNMALSFDSSGGTVGQALRAAPNGTNLLAGSHTVWCIVRFTANQAQNLLFGQIYNTYGWAISTGWVSPASAFSAVLGYSTSGAGVPTTSPGSKYNDGSPHFVVMTYDAAASVQSLYVDGVLVARKALYPGGNPVDNSSTDMVAIGSEVRWSASIVIDPTGAYTGDIASVGAASVCATASQLDDLHEYLQNFVGDWATGCWEASYSGVNWNPTATDGPSGQNYYLTSSTAPTVGSAVNGYTPAVCNGTSQSLITYSASSTLIGRGCGTFAVLAKVRSAPAYAGASYLDPALVTDGSAYTYMSYHTDGAGGAVLTCATSDDFGATNESQQIDFSLGVYHCFIMTWDSNVQCARIDGGAPTYDTFGELGALGSAILVAQSYGGYSFSAIDILAVRTYKCALSIAAQDALRAKWFAKYGVGTFAVTDLSLSFFVQPDYTAPGSDPRWSGTASGGTSGSYTLIRDAGSDAVPTTATAVNGHVGAYFNSSTGHGLDTSSTANTFVTADAGMIVVLGMVRSASATGGAFSDPAICTAAGYITLSFSTSGFQCGIYDGGQKVTTAIACATSEWHLFAFKWVGGKMWASVDGSAWGPSTAIGSISGLSTVPVTFGKQPGVVFTPLTMLESIMRKYPLSDYDLDQYKSTLKTKYGSIFAPAIKSITPSIGFYDGGDTVTIEVDDSTGCTGATVGGTSLTSFTIVDSTHVRGVTGTMSRGTSQKVSVTNGAGTSAANLWETFDPTSPPGASATCVTYYTARHCTQGSGLVTAMPDSKGSNTGVITGGQEPSYVAVDGHFNGYPSVKIPGSDTKRIATTNAGGITTGARSIVMVGYGSSGGNAYWVTESTAGDEWFYSNGGDLIIFSSNNSDVITGPTGLGKQASIIGATFDGTSSAKIYTNAQTATSGNGGAVQNMTGKTFAFGNSAFGYSTSNSMNGAWTEALIYSGSLSPSDQAYIQVGYGKIYGITIGA